MSTCPDVLYGIHGAADASGRCPYCRRKIDAKMMRPKTPRAVVARNQDPLTIEPDADEDYWGN